MPTYTYGGQALIEGVLMRGRDAIAVAFRHPDGHIVWASEPLDSGPHAWRLARAPLVRGLVVLYETLVVGTRWLIRSAGLQAEEDGVELGKGSIILTWPTCSWTWPTGMNNRAATPSPRSSAGWTISQLTA